MNSGASTYAPTNPSADGEAEGTLASSTSHTAAPSLVNDAHHDDPAIASMGMVGGPSSASPPVKPSARRASSRKTPARTGAKASRSGLPTLVRAGHPAEAAAVPRCDVVFSPPGGCAAFSSPLATSSPVFGASGATSAGVVPASASGTAPRDTAPTVTVRTTTAAASPPARVHRVNHPHGFRILKDTSAIERSMKTYFRLPPAPNARLQQERQHIHKELLRVERTEARELRREANGAGVLLDGFLLLSAAGVDDPGEVEAVTLQSSHLVGSVAEDLEYFQTLFFLDVSENELRLEDLLPLESLETLHLAYNHVSSLAGLEAYIHTEQQQQEEQWCGTSSTGAGGDGVAVGANEPVNLGATATSKSSVLHGVLLPGLQALNLSYNGLPFTELPYLSYFPCLEKLDLSGNNLRRLPSDLSLLASVTHLALENNGFTSGGVHGENDVFLPLSSMPSLQEVNLNNNAISAIPLLSVQDGRGLCFPCIETIGLSENKFRRPEALLPLASLHRSLRRVVLSKNPLSTDTAHTKRARQLFDQAVVDAYYERVLSATAELPDQQAPTPDPSTPAPGHHGDACSSDNDNHTGPTSAPLGGPRNADDALWKGQSWSRFILSAGDDAGPVESAGDADLLSGPANATGATPPLPSAPHSGTTASRQTLLLTQGGTEVLSAEEYFYQYRVELVFDEFKMPKQSLRHFYSTGLREGGQNTLVTIPDYKEFMDIYRITGRKKTSWKSKLPGPGVQTSSKSAARWAKPAGTPANTSPEEHDHDEAVLYGLDEPALRRDAEPPYTAESDPSHREDEADEEEEEEETANAPHGNVTSSEDVAFFMTEMDDDCAPRRPAKQAAPPPPPPPRVAPAAAPTRPERPPASVVSPANTNVHAAMHDLRAILRKPLPPLPYGVNGGKSTGARK